MNVSPNPLLLGQTHSCHSHKSSNYILKLLSKGFNFVEELLVSISLKGKVALSLPFISHPRYFLEGSRPS